MKKSILFVVLLALVLVGSKIIYNKYRVPAELKQKFEENEAFKEAFYALTPGRQRGYLLHFAAPKQSKTRESRIEKCLPDIFKGKGMHD